MTYHIYDLVQRDAKHYSHVVLNRKDGSAGLAMSKQVLSQFLVVIAICRKDMLESGVIYYFFPKHLSGPESQILESDWLIPRAK